MIGNGPDYYNGINHEEDARIKLSDIIDNWWDSLDDNYKFELLEPYYPDKLHLMEMAEAWDGLDWSEKVSLWKDELEGHHGVEV